MVEYALLAAFIGIAGWAVLLTLPGVIGAHVRKLAGPDQRCPRQWDPPEPASGS